MTRLLSREEVDQLMDEIDAGDTEPVNGVSGTTEVLSEKEIDQLLAGGGQKVKPFDFKKPNKITKDNIDTLGIIHKELAARLTEFFSGYLKTIVSVNVASIYQLTYGVYISDVPSPSCLSIINLHPLKGSAIIEIEPRIYNLMLDILFGGNENRNCSNNKLTDLEKFAIEKLVVRSFDAIRESWKKIIDFNPELIKIETIAKDVKLLPPDEITVYVTCLCKINDIEGLINILYPYSLIKPIKNKITSQYYNLGVEAMSEPIKSDMDQMLIPVSVVIGEKNFPLKTIKELGVGAILELDKLIDRDMDIYAGNVLVARGEVVVVEDKFGIRVTETCPALR